MDILLIVARVVHVVGGVFWAGAVLFVVHFLEPAVREAGPDGARVMQALRKRRYLEVVPVTAALTLVSGYWLYWRLFGRLHPGPGASGPELALGLGGLASLVSNGRTGYRVRARDPAALAAKITRLLTDEGLRRRIGQRASCWAEGFAWPRIADQIEAVYDELAGYAGEESQ